MNIRIWLEKARKVRTQPPEISYILTTYEPFLRKNSAKVCFTPSIRFCAISTEFCARGFQMCGWVVVVKMYSPVLVNMQRPSFSFRIRICEKKNKGKKFFLSSSPLSNISINLWRREKKGKAKGGGKFSCSIGSAEREK